MSFNMQKVMQQAQAMQKKLEDFQKQKDSQEFTGNAGGGMVSVTITGQGNITRITMDKTVVDPNDSEMLADLITAAHNDARKKMDDYTSEEMGKMSSGMGLPAGFKLPF